MATVAAKRRREAQRWLEENGRGLPLLDAPALDLLTGRLMGTRRAWGLVAALSAVAIGAMLRLGYLSYRAYEAMPTAPASGADWAALTWSPGVGWLVVLSFLPVVVSTHVMAVAGALSDRRLAGALATRVTRSAAVRLRDAASWRVLLALSLGAVGCVVLLFMSWSARPGWPAATVTVTVGVALLSTTAGIAWALRRPTIAYDAITLTLDERLRRADVIASVHGLTSVLVLLTFMRPYVGPSSGRSALAWLVTVPLVIAVQLLALGAGWRGKPYGWDGATASPWAGAPTGAGAPPAERAP